MAASTGGLRLRSSESFFGKAQGKGEGIQVFKVSFYGASRSMRSLVVKASSKHQSIEMINGRKVNGVNVADVGKKSAQLVVENRGDAPAHACLLGRFVEDHFVYRQTFVIRSYEIGPDKTATMETLMNLLQVGIPSS